MNTNSLYALLVVIILFSFSTPLFSQSISGKVIDKDTHNPLAFANVVLLHHTDSTYISGTVTDDNGHFTLASSGNCLLRVSFLGYQTVTTTHTDMGTIYISPSSTQLSEVVVKGTAKTFRMENGGISADIQHSSLKEMGSLPDVLGQLPFVLKNDNSYTVLGKGTPVFYINNRLVRNLNDLQQISSKDIKKVTIVTDPGAEYSASVSAVIKIETIRPAGEGLSGSLYTFNRYNSEYSNWDRLSLNYRKSGLDIFSDLQSLFIRAPKNRLTTHTIHAPGTTTAIVSDSEELDGIKTLSPHIGFNYIVNTNHSLGVTYEYNNTYDIYSDGDIYIEATRNNLLEEQIHSIYKVRSKDRRHYVNAYYNGKLAEWITAKLDVDFISNKGSQHSNSVSKNQSESSITTLGNTNSTLYAGKLVFKTPLWKGNLVYGMENSYTTNEQLFAIEEEVNVAGVVPNSNYAKQNFFAGFVSFNRRFNNLSAEVGVRHENVRFNYYQNDEYVDEQSKVFKKLFPNARFSYRNEQVQMQLAYKYGVRRPGYGELRSAVLYHNPYSYSSGNPLLLPTYQSSLSYTLMWKNLNFIAIYNHYKDFIAEVPELYLDNAILFRPVNLDKEQLTISLNYGYTIGIWKPNLELAMAKDFINYGTPQLTYNKPIYSANFRNNFRVNGWTMGVDMRAQSKGNRNVEYRKASWNTNAYLNKSFYKDRLLINISANDIFDTTNDKLMYVFNDLNSNYNNSMNRQHIVVQLTYRFNTARKRYAGSRASDEVDRL